jgi:hypothetical protein
MCVCVYCELCACTQLLLLESFFKCFVCVFESVFVSILCAYLGVCIGMSLKLLKLYVLAMHTHTHTQTYTRTHTHNHIHNHTHRENAQKGQQSFSSVENVLLLLNNGVCVRVCMCVCMCEPVVLTLSQLGLISYRLKEAATSFALAQAMGLYNIHQEPLRVCTHTHTTHTHAQAHTHTTHTHTLLR